LLIVPNTSSLPSSRVRVNAPFCTFGLIVVWAHPFFGIFFVFCVFCPPRLLSLLAPFFFLLRSSFDGLVFPDSSQVPSLRVLLGSISPRSGSANVQDNYFFHERYAAFPRFSPSRFSRS